MHIMSLIGTSDNVKNYMYFKIPTVKESFDQQC